METVNRMPDFGFKVPRGYVWLFESGVMRYANSPLKPWHLLDRGGGNFTPPGQGTQGRLVSFARRGDTDDVACFRVNAEDEVDGVVLIHGWVPTGGHEVVATYDSFWEWLKSVIDDIAEVVGDVE